MWTTQLVQLYWSQSSASFAHTAMKALVFIPDAPSSRHRNPCIYAWNHSYRYGSPWVYSWQHPAFHWKPLCLCLIASPWPGWKFQWYCHRNPLFIPDSTFWESVDFQTRKSAKNRVKSTLFAAHCSCLTLGNSLGGFRHKQNIFINSIFIAIP